MDEKISPRRRNVIVYMIVTCCALLGWVAIGEGMYHWKESVHHYEAGALSGLYALQTMQDNYKNDHGSYATTFSQLGLPLGARLNGDFLIWDGGYRYKIIDTATDAFGTVGRYGIESRPIMYSYRSRRSFLMDQTGAIHSTSTGEGGHVWVIDTSKNASVARLTISDGNPLLDIAFLPDGTRAYISCGNTSTIYVLDTTTYKVVASVRSSYPGGLAIAAITR